MKKESGEPKFSTKTSPKEQPSLLELFTDAIKDIYWAENHLVKALPKMIAAVTSKALASGLEKHLEETKTHVSRLEQIFDLLGEKVQAQKCDAMEGVRKVSPAGYHECQL